MYKGVFLGLATVDIVYYVPYHPKNNQKIRSEHQVAFAGGPAANAAVAFSALGNQVSLVTGLGEHPLAYVAKQDLATHKVQLLDCTDHPRRPPILASVIVDLSSGERMVVSSNLDMRRLREDAINSSLIEDADIILLDGFYLPYAVQLATCAQPFDIPLVLDGGSWKEGLEELLPLVDYAICSANFFPPGCTTPEETIRILCDAGISRIAITRDADPIIVYDQGQTFEMPVMPVHQIDTLGAGDIFHGAFCHYILEQDFQVSLERAAEIAAFSCTSLGTRAWIEQERFA